VHGDIVTNCAAEVGKRVCVYACVCVHGDTVTNRAAEVGKRVCVCVCVRAW